MKWGEGGGRGGRRGGGGRGERDGLCAGLGV